MCTEQGDVRGTYVEHRPWPMKSRAMKGEVNYRWPEELGAAGRRALKFDSALEVEGGEAEEETEASTVEGVRDEGGG